MKMDIILQGAAAEIQQKGADFTMDSLAKRLHVSKRTIYEKFESKHQIIDLIFQAIITDIHEQHMEILTNKQLTSHEKLSQYFAVEPRVYEIIKSEKIRSVQEKLPQVLEHVNAKMEQDWLALEQFLKDSKEKGHLAEEVDIHILMLMLRGIYYEMINNPARYEVIKIRSSLQKAMEMLLHGIVEK